MTTKVKDEDSINRQKSGLKMILLMTALLCGLSYGCATQRVNHFKSFAEAGTAYADAVSTLTQQSGGIAIDADSLILMKVRKDLPSGERGMTIIEHNNLLKERLRILGMVRRHAQLLRSYFVSLAALANSDASSGIGTSAEGTVNALGGLSREIKEAKVGSEPVAKFAKGVATIVVAQFQNAALENELKLHSKVIEREIDLQQAAFEAIAAQIHTDLEIVLNRQESVEVVDPFKDPKRELPADWVKHRRAILIANVSSGAIDAAADAARNLKSSFVALVENRFTSVDYQALIKDVGEIITLIEKVQGEGKK
jgi:hypothetical protein